jgi:hypothetical protein
MVPQGSRLGAAVWGRQAFYFAWHFGVEPPLRRYGLGASSQLRVFSF